MRQILNYFKTLLISSLFISCSTPEIEETNYIHVSHHPVPKSIIGTYKSESKEVITITQEKITIGSESYFLPATDKEVEERLKNEAIKRGLVEYSDCYRKDNDITHKNMSGEYIYYCNFTYMCTEDKIIFNNGVWAEAIDWNKAGQIVQFNRDEDLLVLTSGCVKGDEFSGTQLSTGGYKSDWIKNNFKLYKGKVILENE